MYPFKIIGGKWGWRPFQAKDAGQGELKPCQIEEFCCFGYLGVNLILFFLYMSWRGAIYTLAIKKTCHPSKSIVDFMSTAAIDQLRRHCECGYDGDAAL